METPKVQTRKNENIITTIVPEEMYQKYLVENLYRTWKERFLDEDTGEVVDVERKEIILERGTFIGEDQLAVINFHTQTGDIDGVKVSDQKRLATLSPGWNLSPWCVTAKIYEKGHNFILLARNIFQALEIVTDYVELHYDKSFYITTARGFKNHIFLQDDTVRMVEEDGKEKPENETEEGKKDVYVFYSVDADVKFGCKFHKDDSEERNYHFLVYAKDVEDVKSRIEKYIGDTIRENKGYGDLGFFEQILIESDFEVTLKTATTVNCSAVICREFTMQYNPEAGEKKEEKSKEAPAEASQDGGLFPEEESPQNE
jgi:hypothetical protein